MRVEAAWAQLHAAADLAAARGSLLFHLDLTIEIGRLALAAQGIATDRLAAMVDPQGYRLIALDAGRTARALAEVTFASSGEARVDTDASTAPSRATVIADARQTIAAERFAGAEAHAGVVIPTRKRGPLEGYAIALSDDPLIVQTAGHWLLTLTVAGDRVVAREPLIVSDDARAIAVEALRGATLTSPDAVPNELHTYLSLKHDVPFTVMTRASGVRWRIDAERTTVV